MNSTLLKGEAYDNLYLNQAAMRKENNVKRPRMDCERNPSGVIA